MFSFVHNKCLFFFPAREMIKSQAFLVLDWVPFFFDYFFIFFGFLVFGFFLSEIRDAQYRRQAKQLKQACQFLG